MKLKAGLLFIVLVFLSINGNSQVLSTKEAKVILVVDEKKEAVSHIELYGNFQLMKRAEVLEKYPNCQFYIGLMEGSYEVVQTQVYPQIGTAIIIFNSQPLFRDTNIVFTEHYSPGDLLKIGKTEARVISNKKGELIIKTQ